MRAKPHVTVVDYGVGNVLSVRRALERCGATVVVKADAEDIARSEHLVLPGVGAFGKGMEELARRGLIEPLMSFARNGTPFLGICLGMQLMFEESSEHGTHRGLGFLRGRVVPIQTDPMGEVRRKIPHIGWGALRRPPGARDWGGTILADAVPGQTSVYFAHSYHAQPAAQEDVLAVCDYAGFAVIAAVARGNLWGCQFHPEKSGEAGLAILRRFLASA